MTAPPPESASGSMPDERGSAIVEFHFLGVLLMLPLVYVLLSVLAVQAAAYGVTQAAREAGRLYVATGDGGAALAAAHVALADQGLEPGSARISMACTATPCHQPGSEVTVTVATTVGLPFLPPVLADAVNAAVPVRAVHAAVVDRYADLP